MGLQIDKIEMFSSSGNVELYSLLHDLINFSAEKENWFRMPTNFNAPIITLHFSIYASIIAMSMKNLVL